MTQVFGHEKLRVYQRGVEFAAIRRELLANLPRRVAACSHLERAAESVLDVYQAELQLVAWVESMLPHFSCSSDVLSKLDGSTTSMVLNTAEGNGRFSGKDHAKFLDIAYKAAVQSAALIDLAVGDGSSAHSQMKNGRSLLKRITAMLTSLKKAVTHGT